MFARILVKEWNKFERMLQPRDLQICTLLEGFNRVNVGRIIIDHSFRNEAVDFLFDD